MSPWLDTTRYHQPLAERRVADALQFIPQRTSQRSSAVSCTITHPLISLSYNGDNTDTGTPSTSKPSSFVHCFFLPVAFAAALSFCALSAAAVFFLYVMICTTSIPLMSRPSAEGREGGVHAGQGPNGKE